MLTADGTINAMKIIILLMLIRDIMSDTGITLCPRFFVYKQVSGSWIGLLSIPVSDKQLPLQVRVQLTLRAALRTKYVGLLELSNPPDIVLSKLLNNKFEKVNYTVRFPVPHPLPVIKNIFINNQSICEGEKVSGKVITNINLEHTFPMNQNVFNKYLSSISNNSEGKYCGKASEALSINVGKIFGQGEWPWLAAIFLRNDFGLQFHCSGSLISMKHIATAAHCTQDQDSGPILPEEFLIYLGKYNLEKWAEPNSQIREVSAIIVHPDFQLANYTADLAVLELSTPIIYNRFVRPVCLWNSHLSLQPPTGNFGIVVGWGKDKTGGPIRTEPRIVQLPIVGQEECLRSRKDFFYITSDRTLCAGFRNGTGPCNGDSGGGFIFFVPNENNEYVWQLRGIISLSLLDQDKLTCDLTHFAVFTDVARFTDWLTHTFNITY